MNKSSQNQLDNQNQMGSKLDFMNIVHNNLTVLIEQFPILTKD